MSKYTGQARPVQTQVGPSANTLQLSNNYIQDYIWYLYVLYKRSLGYTFVGSKKLLTISRYAGFEISKSKHSAHNVCTYHKNFGDRLKTMRHRGTFSPRTFTSSISCI